MQDEIQPKTVLAHLSSAHKQAARAKIGLVALTNQANAEINRDKEFNEGVDGYTMSTLRGNARTHKEAIAKEYQRIEDK